MSNTPSANPSPELGLPPEAQAWVTEHPEADPAALEAVWRLAEHVQPPDAAFEPDPDRVAALRAQLHATVAPEAAAARLKLLRIVPHSWAVAASIVLLIAAGVGLWMQPITTIVPAGETRVTVLPDGSTVELNSGARLSYARTYGWRSRAVRLTGEAFFEVADDAQKPFTVATFNAAVTVLGTRFNVRAWPNDPTRETMVVLEEGQVQLAAAKARDQAVILTTGQMSRVVGDDALPTPSAPASVEQMLIWREGGFFFSDHPAAVILAEVERRFDVPIAVPDALSGRRLGLYLTRPESVDPVLDALCAYLGCRYRATPTGYEIIDVDGE